MDRSGRTFNPNPWSDGEPAAGSGGSEAFPFPEEYGLYSQAPSSPYGSPSYTAPRHRPDNFDLNAQAADYNPGVQEPSPSWQIPALPTRRGGRRPHSAGSAGGGHFQPPRPTGSRPGTGRVGRQAQRPGVSYLGAQFSPNRFGEQVVQGPTMTAATPVGTLAGSSSGFGYVSQPPEGVPPAADANDPDANLEGSANHLPSPGMYKECRKFEHGWPVYYDHLHEMFQTVIVDGASSCAPGGNLTDNEEEDEGDKGDDRDSDDRLTPVGTSSGKRGSSTKSTGSTPRKKRGQSSGSGSERKGRRTNSFGVYLDSVTKMFREGASSLESRMEQLNRTVQATAKATQKEQEKAERHKCWAILKECGIQEGTDEFYAAWQLLKDEYNRDFFTVALTSNEARVDWLKRCAMQPKV